jgi:hypothetical protein
MTDFEGGEKFTSGSNAQELDFYFAYHEHYLDVAPVTAELEQRVEAADVVFIEGLGWSPDLEAKLNTIAKGGEVVYHEERHRLVSKYGKNHFSVARLSAVHGSRKPIFMADSTSKSDALKIVQSHNDTKTYLEPSLGETIRALRGSYEKFAGAIDMRHEAAISRIDSVMTAPVTKLGKLSRALIIYGGAHTGLERQLHGKGYATSHTRTVTPMIFDYRSDVLRRLEYRMPISKELWAKLLMNIALMDTLKIPNTGGPVMEAVRIRAMVDAFEYNEIAAYNKAVLGESKPLTRDLERKIPELQIAAERAAQKFQIYTTGSTQAARNLAQKK